jgi:hypothetical protein
MKTVNRKLVKLMKPFKHVTVIKVELERKFFTRQGMHMNKLGKEEIALKIAEVAMTVLQKQTKETISMYWKTQQDGSASDVSNEVTIITKENIQGDEDTSKIDKTDSDLRGLLGAKDISCTEFLNDHTESSEEKKMQGNIDCVTEQKEHETSSTGRQSKRQRRTPAHRQQDFLWI